MLLADHLSHPHRRLQPHHGLWFVVDASQSLGAARSGRPASSHADALVVSLPQERRWAWARVGCPDEQRRPLDLWIDGRARSQRLPDRPARVSQASESRRDARALVPWLNINRKSLRGNVVLRWEYLRGSTLFVVWNMATLDTERVGMFSPGRDLGSAFRAPGDHVFVVKMNYWLSL